MRTFNVLFDLFFRYFFINFGSSATIRSGSSVGGGWHF
jgi:hypothetical protein